jgi:hypothetical protein
LTIEVPIVHKIDLPVRLWTQESQRMDNIMSSRPPRGGYSSTNASNEAFTINVFGLDGNRRASAQVCSIPDAMEWLDTMPLCLDPQEALMIRIYGPKDFGSCWIYLSPPDAPEDWPHTEAAQRVRALIECRQQAVKP